MRSSRFFLTTEFKSMAEQNVDIPVPGGGLHVLLDPGGSSSSAVSRDERGEGFFVNFSTSFIKCEGRRESESEGARQVELMDSSGLCGGAGRGRVLRVQRRPVEAGLRPGAPVLLLVRRRPRRRPLLVEEFIPRAQ